MAPCSMACSIRFEQLDLALQWLPKDGSLLGYGNGVPPQWYDKAASAEAWALMVVMRLAGNAPLMTTDCLSLLTTARAGSTAATAHNRVLARIWSEISWRLDGDVTALEELLRWQPAHLSLQAVGESKCSDGTRLTTLGWRANRLVDGLAKSAAQWFRADAATRALLRSTSCAVVHAAAVLGASTFAANNHCTTEVREGGKEVNVRKRDSATSSHDSARPAASARPEVAPRATSASGSCEGVAAWTPPVHSRRPYKRRRTA